MLHGDRSRLAIFAICSVAVSFALGLIPFASPKMPVGLVIGANWVLFMIVSYLACPKPIRLAPPFQRMDSLNVTVWRVVFLAFTAAGWLSIMMGQPII